MTKWYCFRPENTSPPPPPPPPVSAVPNPAASAAELYAKGVRQGEQGMRDKPVQGWGEVLVNKGVVLVQGLVQGAAAIGNNNKKKNGFIDSGEQASLDALRGPSLGEWVVGGAKKGMGLVQGLMGYEDQAAKDRKVFELQCRRNDHPDWGEKRYRPNN